MIDKTWCEKCYTSHKTETSGCCAIYGTKLNTKTKMDDKVITIFETKIRWYRPRDILPPEDLKVLIRAKGEVGTGKLTKNNTWRMDAGGGFFMSSVEYWAYLPEFN